MNKKILNIALIIAIVFSFTSVSKADTIPNFSDKLSDEEVQLSNKHYEKIIEEKTGIKVRVDEGILYYDENEAEEEFNQRNDHMAKIIKKMQGVNLRVIEGTICYEEDLGDKDKFNLAAKDIGVQATSPLTRVNRSYPYESDWSGTKNYSYSKYLFELDSVETYFGSDAKTPYGVRFYGSNGEYWFSMTARERRGTYFASTYLHSDLADIYGDDTYYIVMYNDASGSSVDAFYSLDK